MRNNKETKMIDHSEMIVNVNCQNCHELHEITVSGHGFSCWQEGTLIQDALPELSADDRELLISGTCGTCWDKMFNFEEDDE